MEMNGRDDEIDDYGLGPEFSDPPDELKAKVELLIEKVKKAKHLVVYSGAGISASANVPTFRGANGLNKVGILNLREDLLDTIMPTYSHMAILTLLHKGIVKYVVTSNHDNFHVKSGVPEDKIAELFGNAYVERCLKCDKLYRRHVGIPSLGRKCDNSECNGRLVKTGVRFGQLVPKDPLSRAWEQSDKSDLGLVIGSSMTVGGFMGLPERAKEFVLVNLQKTAYDSAASLAIHAPCDNVMKAIMTALQIPVESFTYRQKFVLKHKKMSDKEWMITLEGGYTNETCTCVESACCSLKNSIDSVELEKERNFMYATVKADTGSELRVILNFMEQYGEDPMTVSLKLDDAEGSLPLEFTKTVHYE